MDVIAANKLEAVEVGTGSFLGDVHCKVEELLHNEEKSAIIQTRLESRQLTISALSCHGNPLHPNIEIAKTHHNQFQNTVRLAAKLGVKIVVTFSGQNHPASLHG